MNEWMNEWVIFKKGKNTHNLSQGINEDLQCYAYLLHVNSMPGYFRDHDISLDQEKTVKKPHFIKK